jgi:2-desacetyl-2-hydroxyethyl bacteriochlorophyllide A dehydrogenase
VKRVRVIGNSTIEVEDAPEPEATGDYVVVKVMASAISGTERRYYDGAAPDPWTGLRDNSGHEAAGVVWRADADAGLREGERVALYGAYRHCGRCRHCLAGRWLFCQSDARPPQAAGYHAQYVQIRADFCLPLPDDLDFETGALLAAPFGAAYRAIRRIALSAHERVLIVGQGPLGLAATTLCKYFGARVIASEPNAYRRGCAERCGADEVVDPTHDALAEQLQAFTGGLGVDAAIDCTGLADGRLTCLQSVAPGGRVAFMGSGGGLALDAAQAGQIVTKEISLYGSWYCDPAEVATVAELTRNGLSPSRIITHRFLIDRAADAFATSFGGSAGKVVILPWE